MELVPRIAWCILVHNLIIPASLLPRLRYPSKFQLRNLLQRSLHLRHLRHPTHLAHFASLTHKAHFAPRALLTPHLPILLLLEQQLINLVLLKYPNAHIRQIKQFPCIHWLLISKVRKTPKLIHIDQHLLLTLLEFQDAATLFFFDFFDEFYTLFSGAGSVVIVAGLQLADGLVVQNGGDTAGGVNLLV